MVSAAEIGAPPKARILIVDDHERVRTGLIAMLRDSWDICGEAANGLEAVEKTRELHPDLVLLDLSMPLMSGVEAARAIRSLEPAAKIIFISVNDSSKTGELVKMAGADGFVSKTCRADLLRQTIATVLLLRPV